MRRLAIALTFALALALAACGAPAPYPVLVCAESALASETEDAAARWSRATGLAVLATCDGASDLRVELSREVPAAGDIYRPPGSRIATARVHVDLDAETRRRVVAHEIGHYLEGGRNAHADTGLMHPYGDDGVIDEASLAFVCDGGRFHCATFAPER